MWEAQKLITALIHLSLLHWEHNFVLSFLQAYCNNIKGYRWLNFAKLSLQVFIHILTFTSDEIKDFRHMKNPCIYIMYMHIILIKKVLSRNFTQVVDIKIINGCIFCRTNTFLSLILTEIIIIRIKQLKNASFRVLK